MNQLLPSGDIITLIHLSIRVGNTERVACMPNMHDLHMAGKTGGPNWQRSDDIRAVTCPQCKKTAGAIR